MLFEQGCAQCEVWTGGSAPRKAIANAIIEERFSGPGDEPPQHLMLEIQPSDLDDSDNNDLTQQ